MRSWPEQIYEYELTAPWEATRGAIPWNRPLAARRRSSHVPRPAGHCRRTRRAHTSCRKPHGGGRDGLALADARSLVGALRRGPPPQPHLLVLSGDQIYADEVGHPLMPRVLRVARDLIGVDETNVFGSPPPIGGRGPGTTALGYTGATGQPPVELRRVRGDVPPRLVAGAVAGALPEFPTTTTIPPDVDPDVSKESWDDELLNVELFRSVAPGRCAACSRTSRR